MEEICQVHKVHEEPGKSIIRGKYSATILRNIYVMVVFFQEKSNEEFTKMSLLHSQNYVFYTNSWKSRLMDNINTLFN